MELNNRHEKELSDQQAESGILELLEERALNAPQELAHRPNIDSNILGYLAKYGGVATRRAVAANWAAPAQANRLLGDDEDDEVRAELARKMARLMPDLSRAEMLHLRDITIELLEKLARDQAPRVRAILADEIKHLDCAPKSVIDTLARDVEEIVAAPILEYSPLLSDADLVEIIADARAEFALSAIARRQPLASEVSDAIVGSLDIPALATLLANPKASIRDETLEQLVESAEEIHALHEPLVLRGDLSVRTVRRLASFVGSALLETLSRRRGLDDDTCIFLNRRLRTRLERGEGAVPFAETPPPTSAVAASPARDIVLDEEGIMDAASAGQKEVVLNALAQAAKVPLDTVRRVVESRSAKAVVALVWRAQLSMRVAFKIQTCVMRLPAEDLIPARNGRDFPLTKDEMCWQLTYFNISEPFSVTPQLRS
jgi:uncharacterized protein (DUF2336 family)